MLIDESGFPLVFLHPHQASAEKLSAEARLEAIFDREQRFVRHCKLNRRRSKVSPSVFVYAVCRHAISFHICMATVLSSR